MSEHQLSELLDRAVHDAPPMHLTGEAMLEAGRGRVRRRRATGIGVAVGSLAVVAAVWGGLAGGGSGMLTGTTDIQPASTLWEPGETVEGTLFTGVHTVDQDQVGHSYAAELSRASGQGPVTLVLSDGGGVVERVPAASPVPGLDVFSGERMTVAVWAEPDGVVASVPLVGPHDPGGPANVQHAEVGGEQLAYAVWSADVVPLPEQLVDVYLVGRDRAVALSGAPVRWVGAGTAGHRLHAFADERRGVVGWAVDDQEPVLTQLGDRPAQAFSSGALSSGGTETRVLVLPEGSEVEGTADEDERGVDWVATTLLDRPLALVVREDAGQRPPSDVRFTLGGTSSTFDAYVEDLNVLDVDGTALVAQPGEGQGEVTLWRRDTDEPEATFGAGGAFAVQPVGGSLVVLAEGWDTDATVRADARVEVTRDGAARWVAPTDLAQVALDDGRLVTLLAVDAEDGLEVTGVGLERGGEVERWAPPAGTLGEGVELLVADGKVVPSVDGQQLVQVGGSSLGDARLYRRPADAPGDDLLVLPAGLDSDVVVPVLRKGDGADPAPWLLGATVSVPTEAGAVRVVAVPPGTIEKGVQLALRSATSAVNTWTLMGASPSGHLVLDPGLVVTVGADGWLLYEKGDASDGGGLRAGIVGQTLAELQRPDEPSRYDLVAVLPAGSDPELIAGPGVEVHASTTYQGPVGGVEVWTADVSVPDGVSPAAAVPCLDLDGDGEPDLRPASRG
ncbi:hypothetical protein [Ornithinimicrobium avium]|uniref:Uncharacterized protein n=1 Tax=Ornithinimicrobium avium TaxID=2283195 RepID=A0A345NQH1_9MICO|nr:hypothetical protein [Ornithinimicrobium avium]AXH97279.1 hypothetical protein DV701_15185 [Ornithinimicrobium avium]